MSNIIGDFNRQILFYGIIIYIICMVFDINDAFNYGSIVSFLAFTIYTLVIYGASGSGNISSGWLFIYSIGISTILLLVFWSYSYFVDGDTFLFSKADAIFYKRMTERLIDIPFSHRLEYLSNRCAFDDWGAFAAMTLSYEIWPNKISLGISYLLIGGITAIFLYRIGNRFMPEKYSFLAALAYSTAPFTIVFYGVFLKETAFILFIVLLFNSLYKFIYQNTSTSWIYIVAYSFVLCFFRPAVMVFIWLGILSYYIFKKTNNIYTILFFIVIIIATVVAYESLSFMFNRYTMGGDINKLLSTKDDTVISRSSAYIVNFGASFIGPFPTLLQTDKPQSCLYGAGLLYKIFLNLPLWIGVVFIIKRRIVRLFPMVIFILIESLSCAVVQKGFELRINMPHMAFIYLIAFWVFSNLQSDEDIEPANDDSALQRTDKEYQDEVSAPGITDTAYESFFYQYRTLSFIIFFLVVIFWNIAR